MPGDPIQTHPQSMGPNAVSYPMGAEVPLEVANAEAMLTGSSLESMDKSAHAHDRDMLLPYAPILPYPFSNIPMLAPEVAKVLLDTYHTCINMICDKWHEQTLQQAEAQKEEWKKRIRLGLDQLSKAAVASDQKTASVAGGTALALMMVTFVTPGGQVHQVSTISAIKEPGMNLIQGLSDVMAANMGFLPGDMRAELGLLGALFAAAAFYPAMASVVKEAAGGNGEYTMKFAAAYAGQVAKLVKSPQFDQFIETMLFSGKDLTEGEKRNVLVGIKLAYLFAALGLVYKVETGHITAEEMEGMLNGTIKLPENDPRHALIQMINTYMNGLPKGSRLRGVFLNYFNTNPSIDDLLEPAHLLRSARDNKEYERLTQNRVN